MTGWRCGLVAGNAELIERYRGLKANLDSGLFEAVQRAAAVALTQEREFPRQMSEVYARRRDLLVDALGQIGLDVEPPRATPYFWVRVPEGHIRVLRLTRARPGERRRLAGARLRAQRRRVRAPLVDRSRRAARGRAANRDLAARVHNSGVTARQPDPAPGAQPERGFITAVLPQGADADNELAEVEELALTAGVEPIGRLVQHRAQPDRRSYVGRGSSRS